MTSESQAYIYVQLPGTLNTVPAALLKVEKLRDGTFVGRFRYGDRYLERKDAVEFDLFHLPLGDIVREFTKRKGIPGAVRDAAPDAWGRRVIEHKLQRSPGDLEEIDYLLNGPQDGAGYLSFGTSVEPPASKRRYNRTHELARRCGIAVCNARLESVADHDVLMVERFDREYAEGGYLRFGFVSGLTMLDCDDDYLDRERWSYLLLADQLRRWSEKPDEDRIELFRRIVFNAAVTNNDDHPRNHAMRRTARGWRLTPAYDLVPAPLVSRERRDLAMTIGAYGRTATIYNVLSQCERFGLTIEAARKEIDKIVAVVRAWRDHFRVHGVSVKDTYYIASVFQPS